MRKIVFLMLMLILAGCNGIPTTLTPTQYNQAQGKVIVGEQEYAMIIGEFEWKEKNFETRKLSHSNIYDLADQFETLEVAKGDTIKIEIEQNPSSIIINQEKEDGTQEEVEMKENEITLPTEEGYYIYTVNVKWNEGKITYIFDINIK